MSKKELVEKQYRTADNLNTRKSIHEKYSVNKIGFDNWIFSHYDIKPDIKILELGCGTGNIWKNYIDKIRDSTLIVLTDMSEGMLNTAKKLLGNQQNFSYKVANIESIPYEDSCFDIVIANMMLYHVTDLEKGMAEVNRVLLPNGIFYCATYGENGIMPYIASILKDYGVSDKTNKKFTLQNGYNILNKYFENIEIDFYKDSLEVTDLEDIIDYIYSLSSIIDFPCIDRKDLIEILTENMVDGVLHIPKDYGMFIARNPKH